MPGGEQSARSAPANLSRTHPRSKFLKGVTDRQEEINTWAKNGRPNIEFARQLGQLTENVTLDMMLHEHLMELSRARYKFKTNNRYEKKMFLQRQMRKSSVLKDKLKDVQIEDRRPNWAKQAQGGISRQPSIAPPPAPVDPAPPVTPKKVNALHPSPLPPKRQKKPDSAPSRRRQSIVITEEPQPRAQTRSTFYDNTTRGSVHITSDKEGDSFFLTEPVMAASTKRRMTPTFTSAEMPRTSMLVTPLQQPNRGGAPSPRDAMYTSRTVDFSARGAGPPQTAPDRMRRDLAGLSGDTTERSAVKRRQSKGANAAATSKSDALQNWAQLNRAVNEKRPVTDERYLKLERTLSQPYAGRSNGPKVEEIVGMIGALNVGTKKTNMSRSRVAMKARAMFEGYNPTVPMKAY